MARNIIFFVYFAVTYVPVSENFIFSSDTDPRTCVNITTMFNAGTNAASFSMNLTTTDQVTLDPAAATVNIQDGKQLWYGDLVQ